MAPKVFVSYRRDDARYPAERIYDALRRVLGPDSVFMDVDSIPDGANFRKILKDWVGRCDILLALIGHHWIDAKDSATGHRRLDNPSDFVRIEIAEALARDIRVVPVLLDDMPMPRASQLPDDLKELADRQARPIQQRTFDHDVAELIRRLGLIGLPSPSPPPLASADDERYRAEGRIKVDCPSELVQGAPEGWFLPGAGRAEWFQDHERGPEMVTVPAGSFWMGSPEGEVGRFPGEGPRHEVTIARPFAVGRFAVTFDEWDAVVADGGCGGHRPEDNGWGRGRHPVINVSWDDAQAYVAWLSRKTGKTYRLLSEAEWEYCCRAGTDTPYWWGTSIGQEQANCELGVLRMIASAIRRKGTVPVDRFEPNPWGLYQVHGNVLEWCKDVAHDSYEQGGMKAPADGSAWMQGGHMSLRVLRGGSWEATPRYQRAAVRGGNSRDARGSWGFRVGRTL